MAEKVVEMRLTLRGRASECNSLLNLAIEGDLLLAMEYRHTDKVTPAKKPGNTVGLSRPFNPGARVKLRWKDQGRPAGTKGRVVTSVKRSKGYSVTVRFDDETGETEVASSRLAVA